jgi:hypothetical protein
VDSAASSVEVLPLRYETECGRVVADVDDVNAEQTGRGRRCQLARLNCPQHLPHGLRF